MTVCKKFFHKSAAILFLLLLAACTPRGPVQAGFDAPFTLKVGQSARFPGDAATLTFVKVLRDGRCPSEVNCAAHGPVVVSLSFEQPGVEPVLLDMNPEPALAALGLGATVAEAGGYTITLQRVDPYPAMPEDTKKLNRYEATLSVSAP